MTKLDKIREEIDDIDNKILLLLKRRFDLLPEVLEFKKRHGLPIYHPHREKDLLSKMRISARKIGISVIMVEKIYSLIINESKKMQELLISKYGND